MPFTSVPASNATSSSNGLGGMAILPSSVSASIQSSLDAASSRSAAQATITSSSQAAGNATSSSSSLSTTIDVISQIRVAGTNTLLASQEVDFYLEQLSYTMAPTSVFNDVFSAATHIASETDDLLRQSEAQSWSASVLNIATGSISPTNSSTSNMVSQTPASGSDSDMNSSKGLNFKTSMLGAVFVGSISLLSLMVLV